MPTRYTALASCSCTRKCFGSAGKTGNLERRSGPPPDRLSRPENRQGQNAHQNLLRRTANAGGAGQRQRITLQGWPHAEAVATGERLPPEINPHPKLTQRRLTSKKSRIEGGTSSYSTWRRRSSSGNFAPGSSLPSRRNREFLSSNSATNVHFSGSHEFQEIHPTPP